MGGLALITLRLVATPQGPVEDAPEQSFDLVGPPVVIGRSPGCQVVLADPLRLVSREHVRLDGLGWPVRLTCLSAAAPVRVNDQEVAHGATVALHAGDLIQVGGFGLRFSRLAQPVAPVAPPRPPPSPPPPDDPRTVVVAAAPVASPKAARLDQFFRLDTSAVLLADAAPVPPPAAEPPVTDRPDDLVAAFLAGAGLSPAAGPMAAPMQPLALTPDWMHRLGALLRAGVGGTLALLHGRSTVKREMRAEMTQLGRQQNNPLKFAPDTSSALMHLVGEKRATGFLGPVEAVQDAHDDLLAHHLAVVAGMRAAMFELIGRLGPDAVVQDEGPPRGLAAWWRTRHDAALWRHYRQHHAELTARLDDDFDAVFGREFTKAYEAQARALRDRSVRQGDDPAPR